MGAERGIRKGAGGAKCDRSAGCGGATERGCRARQEVRVERGMRVEHSGSTVRLGEKLDNLAYVEDEIRSGERGGEVN